MAMKKILNARAMSLLCRQQAVFHPENSWKWLGEADRWEHLGNAEIASQFKEGNPANSSDLSHVGGSLLTEKAADDRGARFGPD
jgi:hypothetical protein